MPFHVIPAKTFFTDEKTEAEKVNKFIPSYSTTKQPGRISNLNLPILKAGCFPACRVAVFKGREVPQR